jgi:glycosyltransferase involved in cell wall biosynthesis
MKIILITMGKANPNRMNGVNKIVHQLATELTTLKYDLEVWGISSSTKIDNVKPSYKFKLFRKSVFNLSIINEIKNIHENTVFHFHGVLQPIFLYISIILKLYNKKWVITPHGAYLKKSLLKNYWFKKIYLHLIDRFFTNYAESVQSITLQEYNELPFNLQKKSTIIPNAYAQNNFSIASKIQNEITFGYIGRLDKNHKGLDLLINGFNLFYQNNKCGKLWIVGDGPDRNHLQNLTYEMGLTYSITFFGECHGSIKHDYLQKMHFFIHSSRWDVIPTAVLEAATYQIPLIVSEETGFSQFIKQYNSGIVLEDNSPTSIANAMGFALELYKNKKIEIYGRNTKFMIKEEFNWISILPKIISDLYGIKSYDE